jgi:putative MATE family efflux protein
MKSKEIGMDLTKGKLSVIFFRFLTPFILSNILETFYYITDMVIVGRFVGSKGLSGVSLSSDIMTLIAHVNMGFTMAAQILIGQYAGKKEMNTAGKMFGTAAVFLAVFSNAVAVTGTILCDQVLTMLNTPPEAFIQARNYYLVCLWGSVFGCGYDLISSLLRAFGEAKKPFLFIAISTMTNLCMDLVLVVGCHMESLGAAAATVISQILSFVIALLYLYYARKVIAFELNRGIFKPDRVLLKMLLKLGAPLALQRGLSIASSLYIRGCINAFGLAASTVTGIGSRLREFAHLITNAVAAAVGAIVSQCIAAGEKDRVSKVIRLGLLVNVIYVGILAVLVCAFPVQVFGIFTEDEEVLALCPSFVWSMALGYLGYAVASPLSALLSGVGNSKLVTISGLIESIGVRVILATICGNIFAIYGYWYGNSAAIFVPAVIGGIYYLSGKWRTFRIPVDKAE